MGNRIVEYPARLKKNPEVPVWGREVLVRLYTLEHTLLCGEKVQVFLENPEKSGWEFNMNRKKLMRFKYQNQRVTDQQSIDLYALLKKLKKQTADTQLAAFLDQDLSLFLNKYFLRRKFRTKN